MGVDPYGGRFSDVASTSCVRVRAVSLSLAPGEKSEQRTRVAGRIVLKEGVVEHQGSAGAPPGTSITVHDIFKRQPGRLKFMRSASAESGQSANVGTQ